MDPILQIAIYAIPGIIAITLHEAAHGFVARHFGDDTAANAGRVTLNPLKHIDLFGTILLPAFLLLSQAGFVFGYAKPVPVNFAALRDPIARTASGPWAFRTMSRAMRASSLRAKYWVRLWPLDHHWSRHGVAAQSCHHCQRLPGTESDE